MWCCRNQYRLMGMMMIYKVLTFMRNDVLFFWISGALNWSRCWRIWMDEAGIRWRFNLYLGISLLMFRAVNIKWQMIQGCGHRGIEATAKWSSTNCCYYGTLKIVIEMIKVENKWSLNRLERTPTWFINRSRGKQNCDFIKL